MEPNRTSLARFRAMLKTLLFAGTQSHELSSGARRIFIINLFCLVGVLFTLPLSLLALVTNQWVTGVALLMIASLYVWNHSFLKRTQNHTLSGNIVLYPLYILMLYLVYSGGTAGTGHVWIFCLPIISLFLHGIKRGLFEIGLFFLALIAVLYWVEGTYLGYQLQPELKLRMVLSFSLVTLLSTVYEYITSRFNASLQEAHKQLTLAATTDPLTGLLNRRGLRNEVDQWDSVCLMLLDIDHFKRINDQYGHDAGDQFLRQVAKELPFVLPKGALLSRWGGEEFLVAYQCRYFDHGLELAESLRNKLSDIRVPADGDQIHTTTCVGLVHLLPEEHFSDALGRADKLLYQAKAQGRNRVCF